MNIGRFFFELDSMYANGDQTEKIVNFLKGSLSYAQCEGDLASAVSISNEMGGFYRVNGRFSDGERVLKTALGYISDIGMDGTPDHATTLINLATLLTHKGDIREAVESFEAASDILTSSGTDKSYTAAALENNIASLYLKMGEYQNGLLHTERALVLLEGACDKGDEQGVTYTIAAQIMLSMGEYDAAEEKLTIARQKFDSDSEASPLHRATMEHCLAEVFIRKERFDEALSACERGVERLESCAVRSPATALLRERRELCLSMLEEK